MPFAAGTKDLTGTEIGQSFVQKMDPRPLYMWAPRMETLDERSGIGKVTYNLPSLPNSLMAKNIPDWKIGVNPPQERTLSYGTVTTESLHKHTEVLSRPMNRPGGHRFRDMENFSPLLFSWMSQALSKEISDFLQNTTYFTSSTFSGGAALDAHSATAQPLMDINDDLDALLILAPLLNMQLEAVIDRKSLLVMQEQPQYSGWGTALGGGQGLDRSMLVPEADFIARFKAAHGIKHVEVFDGIYDSTAYGVTSSIARFGSFLWIGLVDRGKSVYNLKTEGSFDTPGGAIMLNLTRDLELVSWDEGKKTEAEFFAGRFARDVIAPQYQADGSALGIVYLSAQIHT